MIRVSLILTLLLPSVLEAQAAVGETGQDAVSRVTATKTSTAPVIDGLASDPLWQTISPTGGFLEVRPNEGGNPLEQTDFRVAFDARNLYVLVRAHDSDVNQIASLLSRRDDQTESDQIIVMIDAYHDNRTGHEFVVNPAGVKADYSANDDGNEDSAWDAVWDVATTVDDSGWTAEYRIPFSQLRFAPSEKITFGFAVWRILQRNTSQTSWPLYRQSGSGFVSQWGELVGMSDLASPRKGEFVPYVVTSNEPDLGANGIEREQKLTVGGDLKYAVAPNLTLNATVNPDFGQVEADPSELNLSAFETFFEERRPFFVEGAELFSLRVNCFVTNDCSTGENLFYSRRIGRSPSLNGVQGDAASPTATRILGAAKLTGRLASGLSVGFLDAVTERVSTADDRTLEPATNYSVLRVNQDFASGNGSVGILLTGVNRSLDEWSEDYLHRSAYAAGLDARRRFGNYEISGSLSGSRVAGTTEAVTSTQRNSTHYLQREGSRIEFDSTRTSLSGYNGEVRFAKIGGQHSRFETGYGRRSAGFETNDLGFLQQADEQIWSNWFNLRFFEPNGTYQQIRWNFNYSMNWNTSNLLTDRAFNSNIHIQFTNRWWLRVGGTLGRIGGTWCDFSCTRGGPALRVDHYFSPWMNIQGDDRHTIVPSLNVNYTRTDGGRSNRLNISPGVRAKLSNRFDGSIGLSHTSNTDDSQWYGNFVDGTSETHYTFARLKQETLSLTLRLGYTFTPEASLQFYGQPYISKGSYSNIRELGNPEAADYLARFQPYNDVDVANNPGGFRFSQFRSNTVFRWEYQPGSTLFLVWSQGRGATSPMRGNNSFGGDLDELFGQRASDVFLVKMSYWLNW